MESHSSAYKCIKILEIGQVDSGGPSPYCRYKLHISTLSFSKTTDSSWGGKQGQGREWKMSAKGLLTNCPPIVISWYSFEIVCLVVSVKAHQKKLPQLETTGNVHGDELTILKDKLSWLLLTRPTATEHSLYTRSSVPSNRKRNQQEESWLAVHCQQQAISPVVCFAKGATC